jgi:hypothetical protein
LADTPVAAAAMANAVRSLMMMGYLLLWVSFPGTSDSQGSSGGHPFIHASVVKLVRPLGSAPSEHQGPSHRSCRQTWRAPADRSRVAIQQGRNGVFRQSQDTLALLSMWSRCSRGEHMRFETQEQDSPTAGRRLSPVPHAGLSNLQPRNTPRRGHEHGSSSTLHYSHLRNSEPVYLLGVLCLRLPQHCR